MRDYDFDNSEMSFGSNADEINLETARYTRPNERAIEVRRRIEEVMESHRLRDEFDMD